MIDMLNSIIFYDRSRDGLYFLLGITIRNVNMKRINRTYIVLFKGITMEDLEDQEELVIDSDEIPKFYNEQPTTWSGEKLLPSDLLCWSCGMHVDDKHGAAFLPIDPILINTNTDEEQVQYTRHGNYCSWPCAVRDAMYKYRGGHLSDILEGIRCVFNRLNNADVRSIPPAPVKTVMSSYCGNNGMTENEYTSSIKKITAQLLERD